MNLTELKASIARTVADVETRSGGVFSQIESGLEYLNEVSATQQREEKRKVYRTATVERFKFHEGQLVEFENELKQKITKARNPLRTSEDVQKKLLAASQDDRAARLVSLSDSPARVIEEIKANLSEPDYIGSLTGWSEMKWPKGIRSKLGPDYDAAVAEFSKVSGIDALREEGRGVEELKRDISLRKNMANVNLYQITAEDKAEAERLGLGIADYMEVALKRAERQRQRSTATVGPA